MDLQKLLFRTVIFVYLAVFFSIGLVFARTDRELKDVGLAEFRNISTPSNPAASKNKLYFKSDDLLYSLDSAGTESQIGSGGAGPGDVTGPGSATDTAIARFDLATGKLLQNSVVLVSDTGDITGVGFVSIADHIGFAEISTPATPNVGLNKLYFKTDAKLYALDDAGTEVAVAGSGALTCSFRFLTAGAGTLEDDGGCVASLTSTGIPTTANFNGGFWATAPNCSCSIETGAAKACRVESTITTSAAEFTGFVTDTAADSDSRLHVICVGE